MNIENANHRSKILYYRIYIAILYLEQNKLNKFKITMRI